jgi:hypothetical protein
MALKPWLPYRRNTIQNAATQAKDGPMEKKVENAKTSKGSSTKNSIQNAGTGRK